MKHGFVGSIAGSLLASELWDSMSTYQVVASELRVLGRVLLRVSILWAVVKSFGRACSLSCTFILFKEYSLPPLVNLSFINVYICNTLLLQLGMKQVIVDSIAWDLLASELRDWTPIQRTVASDFGTIAVQGYYPLKCTCLVHSHGRACTLSSIVILLKVFDLPPWVNF